MVVIAVNAAAAATAAAAKIVVGRLSFDFVSFLVSFFKFSIFMLLIFKVLYKKNKKYSYLNNIIKNEYFEIIFNYNNSYSNVIKIWDKKLKIK